MTGSESETQTQDGHTPAVAESGDLSLRPKVPETLASQRYRAANYLFIGPAIAVTLCALSSLVSLHFVPETDSVVNYIKLGAHSVVTIGFVWFCYGLIRAAERMAIPTELIKNSSDLRLLVGIKSPAQTATRAGDKAIAQVGTLLGHVKTATDIVKPSNPT